jgi:hypothetical protein
MNQSKLVGFACLLSASVACGVAAPEKGAGGGAGGSGSSTAGPTTTTGSGKADGTSKGQCTAADIDPENACEMCVVKNCTKEAKACCDHKGCLDIIDCGKKTGCSDVDCYKPETCQKQIDAAGGIGVALQLAKPLGDCALKSCKTECGGK